MYNGMNIECIITFWKFYVSWQEYESRVYKYRPAPALVPSLDSLSVAAQEPDSSTTATATTTVTRTLLRVHHGS